MKKEKRLCLEVLNELTCPREFYLPFEPICRRTELTRKEVRRHVRALARQGYAEFSKGLWNEDGEPAGAGYCITKAGQELLDPPTPQQGDAS